MSTYDDPPVGPTWNFFDAALFSLFFVCFVLQLFMIISIILSQAKQVDGRQVENLEAESGFITFILGTSFHSRLAVVFGCALHMCLNFLPFQTK